MQTAIRVSRLPVVRDWFGLFFAYERVALLYFLSLQLLVGLRSGSHRFALSIPALLLMALPLFHDRLPHWTLIREWFAPAWILAGYWALNLIPMVPTTFSHGWIAQDRFILEGLGLKHGIETLGPTGPFILETVYLLLYAMLPAGMAVVYFCGDRRLVGRVLLVAFAGTFPVYFLLPIFDVLSPHIAYAGIDFPSITVMPRVWNLWVLHNLDSATGVFPSGHVAVAFSTAFGVCSAMPGRRVICATAFGIAVLVFIATIYGRYHYAADGAVSIVIAAVAWLLTERMAAPVA